MAKEGVQRRITLLGYYKSHAGLLCEPAHLSADCTWAQTMPAVLSIACPPCPCHCHPLSRLLLPFPPPFWASLSP